MNGSNSRRPAASPNPEPGFLPDFCANHAVFLVVLIAELLAFVLVLYSAEDRYGFWVELALTSFFIQWVALGSVTVLCYGGRWIMRLSTPLATLTAYGLTQLITLLFSILALWVMGNHDLLAYRFNQSATFVLRNLVISSIISLVVLRYFYVQQQWKQNLEAEARARLLALQARIRPNFLFNSMNTIVSLIRNQPEQAEQALLDLADLLRSALEQKERISLGEELDITRRYLSIEALRLGERLRLDWQLDNDLPLDMPIPALILQPLVENAIYHGIQPRTEGGCVGIHITVQGRTVGFAVTNPLPAGGTERRQGNRIAQDNIRQRLMLAYGEELVMQIEETADSYRVSFAIPREAAP